MARYESTAEITPFSQTFRREFEPWSIETIVLAQNMECDGKSVEEIAAELQLSVEDVRRHLDPSEFSRRRPRPQQSRVGYPHLKTR
jgi:hypothetical protein